MGSIKPRDSTILLSESQKVHVWLTRQALIDKIKLYNYKPGLPYVCKRRVMNRAEEIKLRSVILFCHLSTLGMYQKHCFRLSTAELDSFSVNTIENAFFNKLLFLIDYYGTTDFKNSLL